MGFWLGLHAQPVALDRVALLALLAGLATLGSYLWKQFNNYKNRKPRFMQTLTENLYFKNPDNNAGVFHRLIDDAEEEECKEAILAYYFLLCHQGELTRTQLDKLIEHWLAEKWQCTVDFEIDDALDKLQQLGLVTMKQGRLSAMPLPQALNQLDMRWDNYFKFNKT